ncbi:hypothetical protein LTR56_005758 [Elasticomyces elasticus]|nr:hypothetical protein LTR56_005758 [Elasticomyces elasticus]
MGGPRKFTVHRLEGCLGLQSWNGNLALEELSDEVEELKNLYCNTTGRDLRGSGQLEQLCADLLTQFGSKIWPNHPLRDEAYWLIPAAQQDSVDYPIDLYWSNAEHSAKLHQHFHRLVVEKCINFANNRRSKARRREKGFTDALPSIETSPEHESAISATPRRTPSSSRLEDRYRTTTVNTNADNVSDTDQPGSCSTPEVGPAGEIALGNRTQAMASSQPYVRDGNSIVTPTKADNKRRREGSENESTMDRKRRGVKPPIKGSPQRTCTPDSSDNCIIVAERSISRPQQQGIASTVTESDPGYAPLCHVAGNTEFRELHASAKYVLDKREVGQKLIGVTGYDSRAAFFKRLQDKIPFHLLGQGLSVSVVFIKGVAELEGREIVNDEHHDTEWRVFQTYVKGVTSSDKPLGMSIDAYLYNGASKLKT